jgi:hypothetical protein
MPRFLRNLCPSFVTQEPLNEGRMSKTVVFSIRLTATVVNSRISPAKIQSGRDRGTLQSQELMGIVETSLCGVAQY